MVIWALYYIACGFFCPFISFWASLAHLLSLGFLGSFPNSAFSWVFTNSFRHPLPNYLILHYWGLMGLPSTPFFLCLHYFRLAVPILTFLHHILPMGLLLLSLRAPFRPIYFLKAHFFISWAYDPLVLPLGLNGFSIHLLTLFCPCCWAFSFYWAS